MNLPWSNWTSRDVFPTPLSPTRIVCKDQVRTGSDHASNAPAPAGTKGLGLLSPPSGTGFTSGADGAEASHHCSLLSGAKSWQMGPPPKCFFPKGAKKEGLRGRLTSQLCLSPGVTVGFFAVCQALVVPTEVSGRVGETLSIRCWYPRGYESYNKYWCRGASRDSCRKVVETEGREVPWQYGRFSINDNRVFCMILLTVKNILEVDAGSYWCGIERTGRDLMELVTVRVVPGQRLEGTRASILPWGTHGHFQPPVSTRTFFYTAALTTPAAPQTTPDPWTPTTVMEHPPPTNASTMGSSPAGPALSTLVPVMVLLSLLAVAGSAGLLYTLHRRREAPCKLDHGSIYDNMLDLAEGGCSDMEQDPELEDSHTYANTLYLEEVMGMPGRHFPGEEVSYMS
ncbi:cmrf35-like molecule 2 [Limosa lapponica baueri]|uniref:Cmrf35-like molecule 2 n=1 Tax=Limosa lapponica baueri TaxID=1758121 RepID=A0A2I0TEQ4_LIMLA|nr:cmrf35-like molecule 2 [Limosa lapponica baueri]